VRALCIDLFCGLGGWTEGFLAEGYDVVGFDIERRPYPAQLVLQDVLTLHGSQFRDAAIIVASPPCQAYSYRAMPWKRAKALGPPDNSLFNACWRIQQEASQGAGCHIPMLIENVRGAEKYVGSARWHFGSYYLWGDVPALMPTGTSIKSGGYSWSDYGKPGYKPIGFNRENERRIIDGLKMGGTWWHDATNNIVRRCGSRSKARKAASAQIAKIPFPLAQWIAKCYYPCDNDSCEQSKSNQGIDSIVGK